MTDERVLTCEEALRFLAEYLDGQLEQAEDRDVEGHLARCRSCYSRAEFEKQLKQQVAALGSSDVRPEFVERIREMMSRFIASPTAPGS